MATKNLVPRSSGEGGIGVSSKVWGEAFFDSGHFNKGLYVSGVAVSTGDVGGLVGKWDEGTNFGNIYYNGGNVGIGTTSPGANLEIKGGSEPLAIYDANDEKKLRVFTAVNGTVLALADGGEDIIRLDGRTSTPNNSYFNGGNVGIGTTEPQAKLDVVGGINFSGNIIPETDDTFNIGAADKKIKDLYLGSNSLHIGESSIQSIGDNVYFSKPPKVADSEGNPASLLSADALGLGTSEVLESDPGDLKFKLLTDENRFVIGTTGSNDLASGWYRFNDFKVKGATDIGSHPINPVDTRIYSDESSFILFKTDDAGNRVAHLVGGNEEVNANNAIALGIAVKVDSAESPEDIEFFHTDGESYSLINGDSDAKGLNNIPIRQGFQPPSIGANPSPLLIDGGSF